MTEEQKEKLREVLKKYPKYSIAYGEFHLEIKKYDYLHIVYYWKLNTIREYKPINQILFNEIMEVIGETRI